jgi:hypothetical protein
MSNIKISKPDAQKKVYELTEKLLHTKKDFKDVAAGYKERIKELENEIKAVVEDVCGVPISSNDNDVEE